MSFTDYLFVFAQAHADFRIPELLSISELYDFSIAFSHEGEDQDTSRPFMILSLESPQHAHMLAERCILVKAVYEFYAKGSTYEELHRRNRLAYLKWNRYANDTSFKYLVTGYNHSISQRRQRDIVESFSYMALMGKIDMKTPEIIFGCFEEYEDQRGLTIDKHKDAPLRQIYFGKLITEGSARSLIKKFDVKKREYFGNTSMEAEISLLMANQAQASSSKLIYDPFVGTGSMIYTTAHFGAHVYGSDIDGRQMRGKQNAPGVIRAAKQYGVSDRIVDLCTFDITQNPWRRGDLFDAIITDPPYGVRAGAKRLGRKKEREPTVPFIGPRPDDLPYIPPTKPYELSELVMDLVLLARYLLKSNGRLVFFLPTVNDEYEDIDIYSMLCEGMQVVANSLQDFGSWGRRLITIRKTAVGNYPPPSFDGIQSTDNSRAPAHHHFREKYFQRFKSRNNESSLT